MFCLKCWGFRLFASRKHHPLAEESRLAVEAVLNRVRTPRSAGVLSIVATNASNIAVRGRRSALQLCFSFYRRSASWRSSGSRYRRPPPPPSSPSSEPTPVARPPAVPRVGTSVAQQLPSHPNKLFTVHSPLWHGVGSGLGVNCCSTRPLPSRNHGCGCIACDVLVVWRTLEHLMTGVSLLVSSAAPARRSPWALPPSTSTTRPCGACRWEGHVARGRGERVKSEPRPM